MIELYFSAKLIIMLFLIIVFVIYLIGLVIKNFKKPLDFCQTIVYTYARQKKGGLLSVSKNRQTNGKSTS